MKKSCLFFVILGFLVFSLAGVSYGWQGRMGGMGDPYGLVQDESDFLIHPAGIADGKGINFYGGYRFNYRDVMDWNYTLDIIPLFNLQFKTSGDEQRHDGLLGAAFPLGAGRMGLFFQYSGKRGDYDGREIQMGIPVLNYNLKSDFDSFLMRLIYGLPMGGFKLGGEIQLAYRQEENQIVIKVPGIYIKNYPPYGVISWDTNLLPFMFPYDSDYWSAILKGSIEGALGPAKIAFTMRGGFIFSGDNKYEYSINGSGIDMRGDIKGWLVGGDFWLRYPLNKDLSIPFVLKMEYQKKTRDGDAPEAGWTYKNKEENLQIEVGGGLDKELVKGTRIAAGLYYGYLWNKNSIFYDVFDHKKYPDLTDHQIILKLSGEKEFSPMVAMRMGLNFFYGWVKENNEFNIMGLVNDQTSLDGSHWGIVASLGGTIKFERFSLEPFLCGGYQKMKLDGDGISFIGFPQGLSKLRKEWSIGGGLSIKFN